VLPIIIPGAISNIILAYYAPSLSIRFLYTTAAGLTGTIIPFTLLWLEPHVNGAAKWKVQMLCGKDDKRFVLRENERMTPAVDRHTATLEARRWAESVSMREIVEVWVGFNWGRWVAVGVAAGLSGVATCMW
jgi:hypothetical protein